MRKMQLARTLLTTALVGALLAPASVVDAQERTVTITGGGYGHGIGMSQYGALGRAKQGKNAEQILEHYYSGSQVGSRSMPSSLRVGLYPAYGTSTSAISFSSSKLGGSGRLAVKVSGKSTAVAKGGPGTSWRAEATGTGGFRLFKNGDKVKNDGRSVFGSPSRPLVLIFEKYGSLLSVTGKSAKYAYGRAEVGSFDSSCTDGYCARLVLALPMQKYLYGLGEVPSSWPDPALKAQAIAGRTYALSKVERSGQHRYPCDCAVYDSTLDQAYIGDAKRTGSGQYWDDWKNAVDATDDQIVKHQGGTIQALYSSSSGGHTEDNENVWGGTAIPYLRGVPDKPDRAGGDNPNFTWKVTMSYASFSSKLSSAYDTGSVKDFDLVKPFGVSGRVTMVNGGNGGARIEGTGKTARVSGWSLRSVLGLKDTLFRVDLGTSVGARFQTKYKKLDGAPGDPVSKTYSVPRGWNKPRGWAQDFEKGRMTRNKATGKTVWQLGPILKKYDAAGREGGALGLPKSGIWGRSGYRGGTYQRGRILWSNRTGAHALRGSFEKAYLRNGGPAGSLGLPTSDGKGAGSLPGHGRKQRFVNGTLYLASKGGTAHALWGRIDERYRAIGSAKSDCGYPTADQEQKAGLLKGTFSGGLITWTEATGVVVKCDQ